KEWKKVKNVFYYNDTYFFNFFCKYRMKVVLLSRNYRSFIYQRRCVALPDRLEEFLIRLPKNLFIEVDGMAKHENKDINEVIYQATKSYIEFKKEERQLHEAMQ